MDINIIIIILSDNKITNATKTLFSPEALPLAPLFM